MNPTVGEMSVKEAVILNKDGSVTCSGEEFDSVDEALQGKDPDKVTVLKTSVTARRSHKMNADNTRLFDMDIRLKIAASLRQVAELLSAAPVKKGYTIYFTGVYGIAKVEAKEISEVTATGGVEYIPLRGSRARVIMPYYSPFILVLNGLNLPEPGDPFLPPEEGANGVTTQRGKYRSTDPRWVSELLDTLPDNLKPVVKFVDGKLLVNTLEQEA